MRYTIVAAAVLTALVCRAFLVSVYKVPSNTMAPTVLAGDFIFASKTSYGLRLPWNTESYFDQSPQRNDLVVYNQGAKTFIKRVVAIAGDEVSITDGVLSLNAIACEQKSYLTSAEGDLSLETEDCGGIPHKIVRAIDIKKALQFQKTKIERGSFLVAADNRVADNAANTVEVIRDDQIIGKPLFIWMSYSSTQDFISESLGVRWNRILTKLK